MARRFSERLGKRAVRVEIQRDDIDESLRTALWNVVYLYSTTVAEQYDGSQELEAVLERLWLNHFGRPLDELRGMGIDGAMTIIRRGILSGWDWLEVYDFLQAFPDAFPEHGRNINAQLARGFRELTNSYLERDLSAYRFVGTELTPITDEVEIEAIESALSAATRQPYEEHLRSALALLSDRASPDYRNSIKESISAVEAVCQQVTGDPKATLGDALKKVPDLHGAMRGAFSQLYGWTSDDGGIRHAMADGDTMPTFAEAKFMLVACSGFVNYILQAS